MRKIAYFCLAKRINRTKPLDVIKKYYPKSSDACRTLMTRSRSVADKTPTLARLHPEMNLDLASIEEAAMLHDIEIFLYSAPGIDYHGGADCIYHGYLGVDLVRREGYPRHALVCERYTGAGLSLAMIEERNLPVPHRGIRPVSLEEQLICFANKFFSKARLTKKKPANKVKQSLSKYGNETVEQFEH